MLSNYCRVVSPGRRYCGDYLQFVSPRLFLFVPRIYWDEITSVWCFPPKSARYCSGYLRFVLMYGKCLLFITDTYNVPIFFHIHVYTEYYIRYSQLTFLMSILYQNNVLAVHLSWQYCIYTWYLWFISPIPISCTCYLGLIYPLHLILTPDTYG